MYNQLFLTLQKKIYDELNEINPKLDNPDSSYYLGKARGLKDALNLIHEIVPHETLYTKISTKLYDLERNESQHIVTGTYHGKINGIRKARVLFLKSKDGTDGIENIKTLIVNTIKESSKMKPESYKNSYIEGLQASLNIISKETNEWKKIYFDC